MAKSIKLETLESDLATELVKIAGNVPPTLVKQLAGSQNDLFSLCGKIVQAYNEAELTEEDQAEQKKIEEKLAKIGSKYAKQRSKVYIDTAIKIGKIAEELTDDPEAQQIAVTKEKQNESTKIDGLKIKQQGEESDHRSDLAKIAGKQAEAAILTFRSITKYDPDGSGSGSREKIEDHAWLCTDLLKKQYLHGLFVYNGPTRDLWFYGIGSQIGPKKPGVKIDREKWYYVGKIAEHSDVSTPTGIQRFCYAMIYRARAREFESLTDLLASTNSLTLHGNLRSVNNGNTGGSQNLAKIVTDDPEAEEKQQIGIAVLKSKYEFDLASELAKIEAAEENDPDVTDDPDVTEAAEEK